MSVYKRFRGESNMQFVDTAAELEAHTLTCCIKAPKRLRHFVTDEIMRMASLTYSYVKAANSIYVTNQREAAMRRDYLTRANCALQALNGRLPLLYDAIHRLPAETERDKDRNHWIEHAMDEWGRLINEEAALISKTKKAERERYKAIPDK